MKKKSSLFLLIFVGMMVVISSCKLPYTPVNSIETPSENPHIAIVDSLFVPSVTGLTTFETNDTKYWSDYGYTLWTLPAGQTTSVPFTSRTVGIAKSRGNQSSGFGIVICQGTREGYGETMLTVMINLNKKYAIGKVINGSYKSVIPWTNCDYLSSGYGLVNTIKVSYSPDSGLFSLFINDAFICTFESIDPVQTSGKNGYLVVISPADDFPKESVKVIFSE